MSVWDKPQIGHRIAKITDVKMRAKKFNFPFERDVMWHLFGKKRLWTSQEKKSQKSEIRTMDWRKEQQTGRGCRSSGFLA
jgi:hypothetical protein